MKDYTFSPQINSTENLKSPELIKSLQTQVFDSLATKKTPKADQIHRRRESKELEEATFQPNINKPQRHTVNTVNTEKSRDKPMAAVERLYQDAELKVQVLKLKRDYLREQELKDCTFTPQITSPKFPGSEGNSLDRKSKSPASERLYQDSMRRKQMQSQKEAAKDELTASQYTFKPKLFTKGYKGSDKSRSQEKQAENQSQNEQENAAQTFCENENEIQEPGRGRSTASNPFERLYGYARKKQEFMIAQQQEEHRGENLRDLKLQSPKSIRDQRSVSAQDSRVRRSQSTTLQLLSQQNEQRSSLH
jgi:hypothetical protein